MPDTEHTSVTHPCSLPCSLFHGENPQNSAEKSGLRVPHR